MEKPYSFQGLVEEFKAGGLTLLEQDAEFAFKAVCNWLEKSALMSETKADDFAVVILPAIKPFVLSQLDKIDGKVG